MITRIWHGKTALASADSYLAFLLGNGTKAYRETPGNLSVKIWTKREEDCCHFYTVTEWEDVTAIRRFAGEQYEQAIYYPEDEKTLLEFEEAVKHYESYEASRFRIAQHILRMKELLDGGAWLGESFRGKLEGLTPEMAFANPANGVHSIAELVWHCAYWKKVAIMYLKEDLTYRDRTVRQENFSSPEALKARGWEAIKKELYDNHHEIIVLLGERDDCLLNVEYRPGHTYDYLIAGVIQHDAYHLGQIAILRKMVERETSIRQFC